MEYTINNLLTNLREEGDSNSRGRKTKGLAILRRGQAGPSSHLEQGNKANR